MRVLITGSSGFIGQHTMRALAAMGYDVVGTDIMPSENTIQADITDLDEIVRAVGEAKPDAVVHLAAISGSTGKNEAEQSLRQPYKNFHVNALGTANLCESCRIHGVNRLVYLSSFAVYGRVGKENLPIAEKTPVNPEHAYAVSKLIGEEVVRTYNADFGMNSIIFRAPFIVGEFQKEKNVVREFLDSAIAGEELVIFGEGRHRREFIHPSDLSNAFSLAIRKMANGRTKELIVLGNEPVPINDVAEQIIKLIGHGTLRKLPTQTERAFDQVSNHRRASDIIGWEPKLHFGDILQRIIAEEKIKVV